jgi:acetylglutamate kinase
MVSPAQKAQQYLFDGNNAVYYNSSDNSFLAVEYKQQEYCVSIAATGKVDKAFLESILTKANPKVLYSLSASSSSDISWPKSIPASFRLTNVTDIEKMSPDGYYTEIYELKAKLSNELIEELKGLMAKYNTTSLSESIKEGNAQLICTDAETIDQLKEQFKQGEIVRFMIYKK